VGQEQVESARVRVLRDFLTTEAQSHREKLQTPSIKLQGNIKLQIPNGIGAFSSCLVSPGLMSALLFDFLLVGAGDRKFKTENKSYLFVSIFLRFPV
jgi:hypothetical protein